MSAMDIFMLVLGMWVTIETFIAAYKMDGGDKLCRVLKYLCTLVSALLCIWIGVNHKADWFYLIFMLTIALFLWPVIVYRITGRYNNRINDK